MGKYFGTDGFRGMANADLKPEHAYKTGRFLGRYFKKDTERPRIVIGTDTRLSSSMLESALASGLCASGADAYLMHVVTTPNVSYAARTAGFDCGVMITASHNRFTDNGIKILNRFGRKISAEVEDSIEKFFDGCPASLPYAEGNSIGRIVEYPEGQKRYEEYLISLAEESSGVKPFTGYRIGLDLANGASYKTAKDVFSSLGAEIYAISDKPDGVNINEGAGSTHPEALQALVREKSLDLGFAFDGDADRCFAADENGEIIDGDAILYICGKYLKSIGELNKGTIAATVMSNMGLEKALFPLGISVEKTDVGDKYVSACMEDGGYSLGGEQSGHIIFRKYSVTGDGILTAVMLMNAVKAEGKGLADLKEGFRIYPQLLKNVEVRDKWAILENPLVKEAASRAEKGLSGRGRLLLRPSGTEPLIRVMVEAETDELCREYVNRISLLIASI